MDRHPSKKVHTETRAAYDISSSKPARNRRLTSPYLPPTTNHPLIPHTNKEPLFFPIYINTGDSHLQSLAHHHFPIHPTLRHLCRSLARRYVRR